MKVSLVDIWVGRNIDGVHQETLNKVVKLMLRYTRGNFVKDYKIPNDPRLLKDLVIKNKFTEYLFLETLLVDFEDVDAGLDELSSAPLEDPKKYTELLLSIYDTLVVAEPGTESSRIPFYSTSLNKPFRSIDGVCLLALLCSIGITEADDIDLHNGDYYKEPEYAEKLKVILSKLKVYLDENK